MAPVRTHHHRPGRAARRRVGGAALLLLTGVAASAPAAEFTVAPPFQIQDAINLALVNGDPFDTIFVFAATYPETVSIDFTGTNQEGITLARATNKRPDVLGGIRIDDARLVTVLGFRVFSTNGDGVAAIDVRDTVGVAILDCIAGGGDDGGLDCNDTFEVIVDECRFDDMETHGNAGMGFGVRITDRDCHAISDTQANGNQGDGFVIDADRVDMRRCTAEDNDGAGMYLRGVQNACRDSRFAANDGVGVNLVGVCEFKKNVVQGNSKTGVKLGESGSVQYFGGTIRQNKISKNEGVGVAVNDDQDGAEIRDNNIAGNESAGIRLDGDRHLVRDNVIKATNGASDPGHGVFVTAGSDGSCIRENTFKDNDGAAVRVEGDFNYVLLNTAKEGGAFVNAAGTTGNEGRSNKTSGGNDFP